MLSNLCKQHSCIFILPGVPLPVIKLEPDQVQLTSELPDVGAGVTFSHQVFMSMLDRDDAYHSYIYAIRLTFVIKHLSLSFSQNIFSWVVALSIESAALHKQVFPSKNTSKRHFTVLLQEDHRPTFHSHTHMFQMLPPSSTSIWVLSYRKAVRDTTPTGAQLQSSFRETTIS